MADRAQYWWTFLVLLNYLYLYDLEKSFQLHKFKNMMAKCLLHLPISRDVEEIAQMCKISIFTKIKWAYNSKCFDCDIISDVIIHRNIPV